MNTNMQDYYNYTISPIGGLFYLTVWKQLGDISGKKILDFGSGFGFTSAHLAKDNDVIAVEPDENMREVSRDKDTYHLITGDVSALKNIQDGSFDVIICHLVLEYAQEREEILGQFVRLLKPDGRLSVVRHNKPGRIIQAVVQDQDYAEAKRLLSGEHSSSPAFGTIADYENASLEEWSKHKLAICDVYGVRSLASLHSSDTQAQEEWLRDMQDMEWELLKHPLYVEIAYFNHVILKKV